jgi:hypothetical protein
LGRFVIILIGIVLQIVTYIMLIIANRIVTQEAFRMAFVFKVSLNELFCYNAEDDPVIKKINQSKTILK